MTTATRSVDVAGGLEVRKTHTGRWNITLPDGELIAGTLFPRQRNARAVRQLLLDALPDWTGVSVTVWPDTVTADQRNAAREVVWMVRRVLDRRSRGVHLCCGHRSCACGTDSRLDGPHYSSDELEWAR